MLKEILTMKMTKSLLPHCFPSILLFYCKLQLCVSDCTPMLKASRNDLYAPEGGSVSLQCEVQHCKQTWSGGWGIQHEGFTFLTSSPRVHLTNHSVAENITRLYLNIYHLNQSDSGSYQCNIQWEWSHSLGHVTHLNVTSVQFNPDPVRRRLSYRLTVCAAAGLCFLLVLSLAFCFSCECRPPPPVPPPPVPPPPVPPPRSWISSTTHTKAKADVVYAALTLERPRAPSATQTENVTTVYSTLNFPTA